MKSVGTEETSDSTRPRTPVCASSKTLRSAARSDCGAGGEGDAMAGGLLESRDARSDCGTGGEGAGEDFLRLLLEMRGCGCGTLSLRHLNPGMGL